jgi:hypothetical protein
MPTPTTAGQFLIDALNSAGITARMDGDGASSFIAVDTDNHGLITISGVSGGAKENEIQYHPSEHQGWGAVHYPYSDNNDDDGQFTEIYHSTEPDIAQDTSSVVRAVQGITRR